MFITRVWLLLFSPCESMCVSSRQNVVLETPVTLQLAPCLFGQVASAGAAAVIRSLSNLEPKLMTTNGPVLQQLNNIWVLLNLLRSSSQDLDFRHTTALINTAPAKVFNYIHLNTDGGGILVLVLLHLCAASNTVHLNIYLHRPRKLGGIFWHSS